jgi:acyl-CoA synthetase (NDP forming)
MGINFHKIETLFQNVGNEYLLEHEVYALLQAAGIRTPEFLFIEKGRDVSAEELSFFSCEKLVLKIVSPQIMHKSDVGGIRFVKKDVGDVNRSLREMLSNIGSDFRKWVQNASKKDASQLPVGDNIKADIKGVLICEKVEYEEKGFGSELLVGLRTSREFGPVVTLGTGGIEVEYMNERLKEGTAVSISSAHLLRKDQARKVLKQQALYDKLTCPFRGRPALIDKEELEDTYFRFHQLGAYFSAFSQDSDFVIEEAEVNPFVIKEKKLIALDGLCRFSREGFKEGKRLYKKIRHILKPFSIGIIGVSEKMNIGHTILNNTLGNGFPADKVYVIKPGKKEIEGCMCVPGVKELPETVDLFVLTIAAEQSLQVIDDIIEFQKARSLIIISGAIGEKEGTEGLEKRIKAKITAGRQAGKLVPVVNGGNCLGVFSRPGNFDTTFVPQYKIYRLPRKNTRKSDLVYLSQSGAFMISRMSKLPDIEPLYAVSIGNQIDLTVSDYLHYLKQDDKARVFAVYIEGFLPGDGLEFARAAEEITQQPGKSVLVYKAGRSPEGKAATASHTASVAGDYSVNCSVLKQAGVIIAESIYEFESYIKCLCFLADKKVSGNRVGLISNAGFECVIMSDSLKGDKDLQLAEYAEETKMKLSGILETLGIDQLQDIRNPLDITPVADDKTFCQAVEAILADKNVDCAVISPLPMSPAMQTLTPSKFHKEDLSRDGSTPRRLIDIFRKTDKPMVVSLDAGEIYQPMADLLEQEGIPVFRRSDEATKFLRKYVT